MISLLGHADELTVGPPTSGYGTSGNIETPAACPHPEIAALPERMPVKPPRSGSKPSARRRAGVGLQKKAMSGGSKMKRSAAVRSAALSVVLLAVRSIALLGALAAGGASAQQAGTDEHLTATQKLGRQVFAQSCGICHLPPQINARTYGPLLSKDTAGGSDEVIRGLISEGTPRMPAFKHYLARAEIDAIIAYLKTVPASATR
jgi:mono/diheme cytochrome c family protein